RGRVSLTQAHPNVWRVWVMLTLVAAVVAWAYWGWGMYHKRTLSTADKRPEGHDAAVPPALTSDSWRTQAEEQAAVGDLRGAIQTLYLGTVDGLSRGGWIVDGPTSTSGEILANVSKAVPNSGSWSAVEALEALTEQADKVSYGMYVVERAQFERCLVWFDQVSALGERP
ncbi:MAG: hypothetical protein AAFS10_25925, partial [Myxococcota bacterium]